MVAVKLLALTLRKEHSISCVLSLFQDKGVSRVAFLLQTLLLFTFLISGLAKLFGFEQFKLTFEHLSINKRLIRPFAIGVVLLELTASVMLFFAMTQFIAYLLILLLLCCFLWSIYRAYRLQLDVKCNCFGNLNPESFGWNTLLRVVLLLIIDQYLLFSGASIKWMSFKFLDIFYVATSSLGVLLVYILLPYALFGFVNREVKKVGGV
ncbi:hypothetical protein H8B09_14360 [Paenibacillus sp. PR3]|uniref:Methylamine utilisation protein MauE domain-containing protein n=1 Tax=Paenibacillus terricola TaxID=2763503 RepID=A0ABR8MVF1_9BACL|nr:MauE/DoxX family redox-associated membrane protein [Paenibacillus terricola]MBD3919943.1 hypothetical protein [Paenibacillus terricola]